MRVLLGGITHVGGGGGVRNLNKKALKIVGNGELKIEFVSDASRKITEVLSAARKRHV